MRMVCLLGCLIWLFSAYQVPTEPVEEADAVKRLSEAQHIHIQLWAGRVKYAANRGGNEWRATFEVKVLVDSSENVRDQAEIAFFWKASRQRPAADEQGWITAGSAAAHYPHGLMSIDGHWIDRQPLTTPPYWIRATVFHTAIKSRVDMIGLCNFLETVEQADTTWNSQADLGYGLGDRILAEIKLTSIKPLLTEKQ